MKPVIRTPYFEVGTKNYVYGDKLLEYARAADAAAEKYDIDVLFICPALEVRRVAENTKHLFVLATYMDTLRPGRGCADILPEDQKLVIETARLIRVGFLQQNAYHEIDTYVPLEKQLKMMELILKLYDGAKGLIARSIPLSQLKATGIFESLTKMKYEVPNDDPGKFAPYEQAVDAALAKVNQANQ